MIKLEIFWKSHSLARWKIGDENCQMVFQLAAEEEEKSTHSLSSFVEQIPGRSQVFTMSELKSNNTF
jgi:hypothetical protein